MAFFNCLYILTLPEARVAQWVRSLDLTTHTSLSPIRHGFAPGFVNYKKRCTRSAAASDEAYQLLAHGRCFSPGTTASSTTKTDPHDIAEILLQVALNTINQSINHSILFLHCKSIAIFHPRKWSNEFSMTIYINYSS
jgi:hypothetical protein